MGQPFPESSFLYFGDIPDQLIAGEHAKLGNVVAVPTDELGAFLQVAAPATLEDWYECHSPLTASTLGRLATAYLISGKPVEVTAEARDVIAITQSLIHGLPDGYRLDFPGDDQHAHLRFQKTTEGDLLLGIEPRMSEGPSDTDSTAMLYALFGSDGVLKDYSDLYTELFDANGQRIENSHSYMRDTARHIQGLAFWMDYLPTVTRLLETSQIDDPEGVQQQVSNLRAILRDRDRASTPFGDLSTPDFLRFLTDGQQEELTAHGQLPESFMPPSLPSESLLAEVDLPNVQTMVDALERWGVPYTEVSYTAGVRVVNKTDLTWAMVDGQIPGKFDRNFSLLPETFNRLGSRNQNDIFARVVVNGPDGSTIEREVLLYDGSDYIPPVDDYSVEMMPRLSVPQEVRSYLAQSSPQHDLRRVEARPTTQIIRSDAVSVYTQEMGSVRDDKFILDQPVSDLHEGQVVLDGQSLPLTVEMRARLDEAQVIGDGPHTRGRQELTISYYRIGDEIIPMVADIRSVTEHYQPEIYKKRITTGRHPSS